MKTYPKYTAACAFTCSAQSFKEGDEVTNPIVLDAVLPFGDRFVTRKSTTTKTPPATPATTEGA